MPIYEYHCGDCGHELEELQKLSDERLTECPQCHASALTRLISAPNFRLKGGGWYETDFKSDKDNKRNLADKGDSEAKPKSDDSVAKPAAKSGDGEATKSASKPEAKPGGESAKSASADKPKPKAKPTTTDAAS